MSSQNLHDFRRRRNIMKEIFARRVLNIFFVFALVLGTGFSALAQSPEATPRLPLGPQPAPGPGAVPFGSIASENYVVSSSANEHGSYLWVVAPIQHVVVLCEKPVAAKDFSCEMKKLP
jgi:hypothetical protein